MTDAGPNCIYSNAGRSSLRASICFQSTIIDSEQEVKLLAINDELLTKPKKNLDQKALGLGKLL